MRKIVLEKRLLKGFVLHIFHAKDCCNIGRTYILLHIGGFYSMKLLQLVLRACFLCSM
jgi:hypothetical protein